jgi:hypothetical protein
MVGVVGLPSRIQPRSSASSTQSAQTSTISPPAYGWKRTARSPRSSERSQISQLRLTFVRVRRITPRV